MFDAVFDTNVLVAGLRSRRGASFALLRSLADGTLRLHVSVALALEYEEVLKRPGLIHGFTPSDVDSFLDYLFRTATLWSPVARVRPSLKDPKDEHILEVAVQSRAAIVTHNLRDFEASRQFGVNLEAGGIGASDAEGRGMNVNLEISGDLYEQARQLAESQGLRIDEVITSALSDQLANFRRLQNRAARGDREKFLAVLDRVPDLDPDDTDRL